MKPDGSEFDRLLLDQIADRWSILVLGAICAAGGTLRFNEVRRRIDGIAQKTLTQALRRLERNGILERRLIDTARCFRSLLLVTCPHLHLTKTFVPDLEEIRIGDANLLITYCDLNLYTNPTNN